MNLLLSQNFILVKKKTIEKTFLKLILRVIVPNFSIKFLTNIISFVDMNFWPDRYIYAIMYTPESVKKHLLENLGNFF